MGAVSGLLQSTAVSGLLQSTAVSGLLQSTAVSGLLQSTAVSGLLQSTAVSVMTDLSQYKTLLADISTGCGLNLQYGGVFMSRSLLFMALCW
jgi:hypothetical protein